MADAAGGTPAPRCGTVRLESRPAEPGTELAQPRSGLEEFGTERARLRGGLEEFSRGLAQLNGGLEENSTEPTRLGSRPEKFGPSLPRDIRHPQPFHLAPFEHAAL